MTYREVHKWVQKNFGKAQKCESKECSKISSTFQWSNVSQDYKLDRGDWQQLCVSCHKNYDAQFPLTVKGHPRRTLKGYCSKGHELTEDNVRIKPSTGYGICKECQRQYLRNFRLRRKIPCQVEVN